MARDAVPRTAERAAPGAALSFARSVRKSVFDQKASTTPVVSAVAS